MFSHRAWGKTYPAVLLVSLLCVVRSPTIADAQISATQPANDAPSAHLSFVRVFSSADDVRRTHPIFDRTLDIIAGPADPVTHVDALQSPSAIATDSNRRVIVADPGAATACRIPPRPPSIHRTSSMSSARAAEPSSSTTPQ